jgi:hypothetical protein
LVVGLGILGRHVASRRVISDSHQIRKQYTIDMPHFITPDRIARMPSNRYDDTTGQLIHVEVIQDDVRFVFLERVTAVRLTSRSFLPKLVCTTPLSSRTQPVAAPIIK